MNKLIKPVKKALVKEYGYKNVSVVNGQGTAWGWIMVNINNQVRGNDVKDKATMIARQALKNENMKAYTFTSDDGYDTEYDEMLIQVNYID